MGNLLDFRKNYSAILKSNKLNKDQKIKLLTGILSQMNQLFDLRTGENEKYNTDSYDAITLYLEISTALNTENKKSK